MYTCISWVPVIHTGMKTLLRDSFWHKDLSEIYTISQIWLSTVTWYSLFQYQVSLI